MRDGSRDTWADLTWLQGWDFPGWKSPEDFLTLLHSTKNDCQGLGLSSQRELIVNFEILLWEQS